MKGRGVAITGGAGFISSHLAGELATAMVSASLMTSLQERNDDGPNWEGQRKIYPGFHYKSLW